MPQQFRPLGPVFQKGLTGLSWSDWIKSRSDLKTGYFNTDPDNPDPKDQDSAFGNPILP